jgi:hypothetical protein
MPETKRFSFGTKLALLFAGIMVVILCTLTIWRVNLARHVSRELSSLQKSHIPTSGKELDDWYSAVPEQENMAVVISNATSLLKTFSDRRSNQVDQISISHNHRLEPDERELLSQYVEMNRHAISAVKPAMVLSKSRYPIDLSDGLQATLPHLQKVKTLGKIASFEANQAFESGDVASAIQCLDETFTLARSLDREPTLISQLVRCALVNLAVNSLEVGMSHATVAGAEARTLDGLLKAAERTNSMTIALIGERAMAIPYFRMSQRFLKESAEDSSVEGRLPKVKEGEAPPTGLFLAGVFERDLRFYLESMATNISLISLLPPRSLETSQIFTAQSEAATRQRYIMSDMFLSGMSRCAVREASVFARLRSARLAIVVEGFRMANGRLPNDSEMSTNSSFEDPFDGKPLRYKRLQKGYIIYSVGEDREDNGGKERPYKSKTNVGWDLTFTVDR